MSQPDNQERPRDYRPSPGRVTVIRTKAKTHYVKDDAVDIAVPVSEMDRQEFFSIYATVARVGDPVPGGIEPWFQKGDVVTIVPSLFVEVNLVPGMSIWNGPFSAVSGVFEDPEEEDELQSWPEGGELNASVE